MASMCFVQTKVKSISARCTQPSPSTVSALVKTMMKWSDHPHSPTLTHTHPLFQWSDLIAHTRPRLCYISSKRGSTSLFTLIPRLLVGGGKKEPGIHCLRMSLISQKSWEIRNYCVISVKPWPHNVYILTATLSANFLTDDGSLSVVHSSAPSSSLQRLGTSDMNLKEVQVASSLHVC